MPIAIRHYWQARRAWGTTNLLHLKIKFPKVMKTIEILRDHDSSATVIGSVVEGAEKRVTLTALNLSGTGSRFE